jgi:hypothetical protein
MRWYVGSPNGQILRQLRDGGHGASGATQFAADFIFPGTKMHGWSKQTTPLLLQAGA